MPRPSELSTAPPSLDSPPRSSRLSPVRSFLSQAAQIKPERTFRSTSPLPGGPEFERVRNSLRQLKHDVMESQQLAFDADARAIVEHVRSTQRAFTTLSEAVEDELSQLRGSEAQQREQLRMLSSQLSAEEGKGVEMEVMRSEISKLQGALSQFTSSEHAQLAKRVETLESELAESRNDLVLMKQAATEERQKFQEELGNLKRWRAGVAAPFIDLTERTMAQHEQQLEKGLPPLQKSVRELEERVSKELVKVSAQMDSLHEAHRIGCHQLEVQIHAVREELRRGQEAQQLQFRQAPASGMRACFRCNTDSIRQLAGEEEKLRGDMDEENQCINAAINKTHSLTTQLAEKLDRVQTVIKESQSTKENSANREAQTLEAILNVRAAQNQCASWMEHMGRELAETKASVADRFKQLDLESMLAPKKPEVGSNY
ncbi:MAG: hypothetical protein SGPRY_012280 [Prymnesium sp.]